MRHKPNFDISSFFLSPETSVRDAIAIIDRCSEAIGLVVDEDRKLMSTVTDGDLRRALLRGVDLGQPMSRVLELKEQRVKERAAQNKPIADGIVAEQTATDPELLHLMNVNDVRHIPLLDTEGRVVDLALHRVLTQEIELPVRGVVMAGGFGVRLHPLTVDTPKPMLPLGDRPIMERIVEQMKGAGVTNICVTTHFKGEKIRDHFGDGSDFGVSIGYLNEDKPLGTAGSLHLIDEVDEPLLVINGDIFSEVDFRAMFQFHKEHEADFTIGVREYEIAVPYGVVTLSDDQISVSSLEEKPNYGFFVNAGVYILEPSVLNMIPKDERWDMTDLISKLLKEKRNVVSFPIVEYWLDIGQHEDYKRAHIDAVEKDQKAQ